jgi:hypothetical protein
MLYRKTKEAFKEGAIDDLLVNAVLLIRPKLEELYKSENWVIFVTLVVSTGQGSSESGLKGSCATDSKSVGGRLDPVDIRHITVTAIISVLASVPFSVSVAWTSVARSVSR